MKLTLGEKIMLLRKKRQMNQNELGDLLHLSSSHVANLENNRHNPTIKTLIELADIFEVTVDYLVRN
ncbi:XRE family transcriptional regulator [Candidatus Marinamargulisbacteria bacterium SCGC AAA071-K20]|nr:XRE family transcriptional regulator [Candidatus Marinamargulisbacteria bacterium SCGC AAA071-K20]